MNAIIQALIFASFLFEAGFGLFGPVFAVFVTENITGGTVATVGYAAAIYWILKSALQVPVGRFLDKHKGEIDDFWALFIGQFLMGVVAFLYAYVTNIWELFMLQVLLAVGGALVVPAWYGMFIRHVDKAKEGFEWSLNSSLSFGLGAGGAGALGGYLAGRFSFPFVFIAGAIVIWLSLAMLVLLHRRLKDGEGLSIPRLPPPL